MIVEVELSNLDGSPIALRVIYYRIERNSKTHDSLCGPLIRTLGIKAYPVILRWCGGWDLNPRRPTPSGPQPDPFDLARAPPPIDISIYGAYRAYPLAMSVLN